MNVPVITAASLVPWIVTDTCCTEPSLAVNVYVSTTVSVAPRFCTAALSSVYVQVPDTRSKLPYALSPAALATSAKLTGLSVSTSLIDSPPVATSVPSSATSPVNVPVITAASLVPRMFTTTLVVVPSFDTTSNVSVYVWPATNSLCAESAVYVHEPSAPIANVPYVPAVPACATYSAGVLSTSLIVSVPLVLMSTAESVSVRSTAALASTAASLVPFTVTTTT